LLLITTFAFLHSPGTPDVTNFWLPWMENIRNDGLVAGFGENQGDYPPLTAVYLLVSARVSTFLGTSDLLGLKLSLTAFLLATSGLFWLWTRDLLLTAVLHLSLILNSVALGYLDVYVTLPLVGALWALKEARYTTFALLFAAACLAKWQPLIVAPFLMAYALRTAGARTTTTRIIFPGLALLGFIYVVFGNSLVTCLIKALTHPYLSGRALNLNWIITYALHALAPQAYGELIGEPIVMGQSILLTLGKGLFWAVYASVMLLYFWSPKTFENLLLYSVLGYMTYFTLNTGVHENHMVLAGLLSVVLYSQNRAHLFPMIVMNALNNLNLFLFYGMNGAGPGFSGVVLVDLTLPVAMMVVIFFMAFYRTGVARVEPLSSPRRLGAGALPGVVCSLILFMLPLGVFVGNQTAPQADASSAGVGVLEAADAEGISGWAWNPKKPDDPVRVELYDGGTLLATVLADHFRPDLQGAGYGNGKHGFSHSMPAQFQDGKAHVIRAVVAGTATELFDARKSAIAGKPVHRPAANSLTLDGSLDVVNNECIHGWAWDSTRPDDPISVGIYDGNTLLASVVANEFREDLGPHGIGNGLHAFTYETPKRLKDGKQHNIRILASGTTKEIGSKTFTSH
jgi:hypothetical protein